MKKLSIAAIVLFVLLVVASHAQKEGHMKLLAVSDTENGQIGGIADLFLEIKPGEGRVFLETFPLTRVDTQISTRFAKQIACDFADVDCDQYDFFYTITADSPIIAGPSAGAAITVLTFSLITNTPLQEDVAITGTINSGGLIGPVGGIQAKVEAAARAGIDKALIPFAETILPDNDTNESIDIRVLQNRNSIDVVEVATLDEALFEFTGKRFKDQDVNLKIDDQYKDTMRNLAIDLCSRSTRLQNNLPDIVDNRSEQRQQNAINLSARGKESFDDGTFYAAASFCFGANVEFNFLQLQSNNFSEVDIMEQALELRRELRIFEREIEREDIKTITDLESFMVVKERIIESREFIDRVQESINNTNQSLRNLAYATERYNSAQSWATFLDNNNGRKFNLNKDVIRNACQTKLSEVEERMQYVQLYFPQNMENTRRELELAYLDLQNKDYELCLFKASKAKASVDTVLNVFGVRSSSLDTIVNKKLEIVERNLAEETEAGVFPILGYSYFEYANSLKENDPFSALLYSSYALEMGDLDIYFKDEKDVPSTRGGQVTGRINPTLLFVLLLGIVLGFLLAKVRIRE